MYICREVTVIKCEQIFFFYKNEHINTRQTQSWKAQQLMPLLQKSISWFPLGFSQLLRLETVFSVNFQEKRLAFLSSIAIP